jgi:hypothetical protein
LLSNFILSSEAQSRFRSFPYLHMSKCWCIAKLSSHWKKNSLSLHTTPLKHQNVMLRCEWLFVIAHATASRFHSKFLLGLQCIRQRWSPSTKWLRNIAKI